MKSVDNGVPPGWTTAEVRDLASLTNGFAFKPEHWKGEGLPIIRIKNLNDPEAPFNYCPDDIPEKFKVHHGDVLFAWSGTPGTSFGAHIWHGGDAWLNQHIYRVDFDENLCDKRFLRMAINENLDRYIREAHGGAGLAHITKGKFEQSELLVAPRREQRRIADVVDELFSQIDAGVASLESAQAKLEKYRASILKAAVEGKLTADWRKENPDVEPADRLLERILAERRKRWEEEQLAKYEAKGKKPPRGWREKYEEPLSPYAASEPGSIPDSWTWTSLDAVIREDMRNGHSAKKSPTGEGVRTFTLTAVTQNDFSEEHTKLTVADPEKVHDLWAQPGDLFLERSNTPELVGLAALYKGPPGFAIFPDLLIRIRTVNSIDPEYLEIVLRSQWARYYFMRRAKGISGSMPKLSQSDVAEIPIPVPPHREQRRIVDEVDNMLMAAAHSRAVLDSNMLRSSRLRQSILKAAFQGKLVPQDRADEPASELLERIKAEKNAAGNSGKKKPKKKTPTSQKSFTLTPKHPDD